MSTATMHQQVQAALVEDPILTMLGFDRRNVDEQRPRHGSGLEITWSGRWHGSTAGLLGTVTVNPVGVDHRTRSAVLDRIELVLNSVGATTPGPVRRVRRVHPRAAEFNVLGHVAHSHRHPPPRRAGRADQGTDRSPAGAAPA